MEKLHFVATVIVLLTLTESYGQKFDDHDQDHQCNEHEVTTDGAEKTTNILGRIKVLSGQNVKDVSSQEKNVDDQISVDKKEINELKDPKEKNSESSGINGHVEAHDNNGIAPREVSHDDLSRIPRQSPSNSAGYQEKLQQQIRDHPDQVQKIKEMQTDAQARYQQALDSERAKNMQGQMGSRKKEFGDSEQGRKMKEGGMKKGKQRKGKGGKGGREGKKGSRKGSEGRSRKGKGERGEKGEKGGRKNKQMSGERKGKGDREGKRKKDRGSGSRERTRGGGARGQGSAAESI